MDQSSFKIPPVPLTPESDAERTPRCLARQQSRQSHAPRQDPGRGAVRHALGGGGRDVAGQFAHLHAVRITWLESFKKDFAKGLVKLDAKGNPTKATIAKALTASGEAVERFIEQAEAGGNAGSSAGLA